MILAYIQVPGEIHSEAGNVISVNDIPELVNTENVTEEEQVNTVLLPQNIEEDSFEVKYMKLMKQIEKERFERELIAGSR